MLREDALIFTVMDGASIGIPFRDFRVRCASTRHSSMLYLYRYFIEPFFVIATRRLAGVLYTSLERSSDRSKGHATPFCLTDRFGRSKHQICSLRG